MIDPFNNLSRRTFLKSSAIASIAGRWWSVAKEWKRL